MSKDEPLKEEELKAGLKVRISLPGDQWDGEIVRISFPRSERAAEITHFGKTALYCIAALRAI